ncbi:MAG: hypothetical protein CMJ64_25850 [Planctomycetaceae bacterium]|nr:hypothetical protein [Planctomycetaceae bacterium]
MSDPFDPYYEWLGIPPKDQPTNHYRLLGIETFEDNLNVIERAADRQMGHVRTFQNGQRSAESQRLLNELSAAKVTLLQADKKTAYDDVLREQIQAQIAPDPEVVLPVPIAQPVSPVAAAHLPLPASVGVEPEQKGSLVTVSPRRRRQARRDQPKRLITFVGTLVVVVAVGLIAAVYSGVFSSKEPAGLAPPAWKPAARANERSPGPPTTKVLRPEPPKTPSETPIESTAKRRPPTITVAKIDESQEIIEDLDFAAFACAMPSILPSSFRRTVESGGGIVADRFLLCQSIAYDELVNMLRPLARYGWRPLRIRPYSVGSDVLVAAVWTRDSRPWRFVAGVTASEYTPTNERFKAAGFEPVDVAGFGDSELRFTGVWVESKGEPPDSELWLARTPSEFKDGVKSRKDSPLVTYTCHVFVFQNRHRYSVVWKPSPAGATQADRFSGARPFFESRLQPGDHLLDISVASTSGDGHVIDAALVRGLTPTTQLYSLTAEEHLQRSRELAEQGLVPLAISVALQRSGAILEAAAASVWESPPGDAIKSPLVAANTSQTTPSTLRPIPNPRPFVAATPKRRLAVPSAEDRRQASTQVKDIYRDEFASANDPAAKVTLANELLKQAAETEEGASKFGLLFEARLLAVEAVNPHLALRLTEQLTDQFDVASWTLKLDTMVKLTEAAKSQADRRVLADLVLDMSEEALLESEFEAAEKQVGLIARLNRPRDRDLAKAALALGKRITEGTKLWWQAEAAKQKLAAAPDDPEANLDLGQYLCFVKEDWEAGLPHLAKGTNVTLKELASKDLQEPTEGKERLAVADGWYDWGAKAAEGDRNGAWLRAKYWYRAALPGLADLDRTKAKRRSDEISEKVAPNASRNSKFAWLDVNVGLVRRLEGHTSDVLSLAVTRTGKHVVSGSRDQTVRFWDLATGEEVALLRPGVGSFTWLGLSPDDKFVIVSGASETVEVWNLQTGKLADRLDTKVRSRAMAVARDSNILLWALNSSGSGNLRLFAMRGGPLGQLNCRRTPVTIAISDNGRLVAAGSSDDNVYVWSLRPAKTAGPFSGLGRDPNHVALSFDGRLVAACSFEQAMVWDINSGNMISRMPTTRSCYRIAFSPDGQRLLSAGMMNEVTLWNVEDGSEIQTLSDRRRSSLPGSATAVQYLSDARGAVSSGTYGVIRVWRLPD